LRRLERVLPYLVLAVSAAVLAGGIWAGGLRTGGAEPIVFHAAGSLPDGAPIRVQVSGEVRQPGVYELAEGDRVLDALDAAGGPSALAETESLNQARRLRDGEQIIVPARTAAKSPGPVLALASAPLDINTATEQELDTLPGIGAAYSRRIVDSRTVDGPFASIEDLARRRVLPASTLEGIRDLITVLP